MQRLQTLSVESISKIKGVLERDRNRVIDARTKSSVSVNLSHGVYVATPVESVPAYSGGQIKSYEFNLHRFYTEDDFAIKTPEMIEYELQEVEFTDGEQIKIRAFNISTTELTTDQKYILSQDLWGHWVVILGGGGAAAPPPSSGVLVAPVRCPLDTTAQPDGTKPDDWDDSSSSDATDSNRSKRRDFFNCMGRIKLTGKTYNKTQEKNSDGTPKVDSDGKPVYKKAKKIKASTEGWAVLKSDRTGYETEDSTDDDYDYDYVACLTLDPAEVLVAGLEFDDLQQVTASYTAPKKNSDGTPALDDDDEQILETKTLTYYVISDPPALYTAPMEGRPKLKDGADDRGQEPAIDSDDTPTYWQTDGVCKAPLYDEDGAIIEQDIYALFYVTDINNIKFPMLGGVDLLPLNYSIATRNASMNYMQIQYELDDNGDKIPEYDDNDCFLGYKSSYVCSRYSTPISYEIERRITNNRYRLLIIGGSDAYECAALKD
ncbi:MAG: hypothetical protein LBP59_10360 [Planctomycetaceae bacterium]|nr:hypothetical protein [Planctomycetaceae bacterium]